MIAGEKNERGRKKGAKKGKRERGKKKRGQKKGKRASLILGEKNGLL